MSLREIFDKADIRDVLDDLGKAARTPTSAAPCPEHSEKVGVTAGTGLNSDQPPRSVTLLGCCDRAIDAYLQDITRRAP